MTLAEGNIGETYTVASIETEDEELKDFLFTLGCYDGEPVTIVSTVSNSLVLAIRDGRYNVDKNLAGVIQVEG